MNISGYEENIVKFLDLLHYHVKTQNVPFKTKQTKMDATCLIYEFKGLILKISRYE